MLSSSITQRSNHSSVQPERKQTSNQFGMHKHNIKVTVNEMAVVGTLMLSDEVWAFSSDDASFLSVFPTGMTYSFSQFAPGDTYHRKWQHAIEAQAGQLRLVIK